MRIFLTADHPSQALSDALVTVYGNLRIQYGGKLTPNMLTLLMWLISTEENSSVDKTQVCVIRAVLLV
ncbi:unnamed protein product [Caretta caretta]